MSDARVKIWNCKIKSSKHSLPPLKSLPPTTEAFSENTKRAHLQASIWRSAMDPRPPNLLPTDYGFENTSLQNILIPVGLPPSVLKAPKIS